MTQVIFAHGLLGNQSSPYEPETYTQGNVGAVRNATEYAGAAFYAPAYQRIGEPGRDFPTVSEMGNAMANAILEAEAEQGDQDTLLVGSSVGAAVLLQATLEIGPRNMVLFKPIYDVVAAIGEYAQMLDKSEDLEEAMQDPNGVFNLPVMANEVTGEQGVFPITQRHLEDPTALRLLTHKEEVVARLLEAWQGQKIDRMMLIADRGDPLSSPLLADYFSQLAAPLAANPIVKRNMVLPKADHSNYLQLETAFALRHGWARKPRG